MRIGLMHDGGNDVSATIDQIVGEEADGFECAWFGQVFSNDSMTVIALAGQRTSRIEFGTAVIPTYGRHPFVMAQQAITVSSACGGRFALGVGPSHAPVIEGMWGMSYEKPARHVREYLGVLVPLLRDGKVSFAGEVYRTAAAITAPHPAISVLVSALAPQMLKITGSMTDGTLLWMTGPKTIDAHVVPLISQAASEAGRPAPRIVAGLPVCVTDDVAAAREFAAKAFAIYGTLPNYRRMLDREGAAGPADVAIIGGEEAVERSIRDLASAGATDLNAAVFPSGGGDARESMARTRTLLKSLIGKV